MSISAGRVSTAHRLLPVLGWLPGYKREWLLPDVLAGLAIWAVMVPEGMAYAGIVGVPPIMGLYTIVPPLIAYALLGTSRLLVVGPDTATGLISGLTVGAIAAQGTAEFNALTCTLAIWVLKIDRDMDIRHAQAADAPSLIWQSLLMSVEPEIDDVPYPQDRQ